MPADFRSHVFLALLNVWGLTCRWWPYLVGGILLAALLNTFVPRDKFVRLLSTRKWWMLPLCALAGMVSPGCTYGTAPIFVETVKVGAGTSPAATFLVASSLVNPQVFLLIAGTLGFGLAATQAAASLIFAVGVGMLVSTLCARGVDIRNSGLAGSVKGDDLPRTGRGHHQKHVPGRGPWMRRLCGNILDLTEFIGFYFLIGAVIAAFVAEFVPGSAVLAAAGRGKWWAIPCAAVVSVPTYVCGGGTLPLLSVASGKGMAAGAVIAFLIAGPATRATALSALAVLFRKRAVFVYAVLVIAFSILLGVLLGGYLEVVGDASRSIEL